MPRTKTTDILMWVGASHYPTVESFVKEAEVLGVSKRVSQVPKGVKLRTSVMFLAHDEAARVMCLKCKGRGAAKGKLKIQLMKRAGRSWEPVFKPKKGGAVEIKRDVPTAREFRQLRDKTYKESDRKHTWRVVSKKCPECKGRGEIPDGRIFGFCVIERLELVFDCSAAAKEYKDRHDTLGKKDRIPVTYIPGIEKEPKRGCGYRHIGGYYLASGGEDDCGSTQTLSDGLGPNFRARGPLVIFPEPVAYPEGRFRAVKVIDKHTVFKAAKASAKALLKKRRPRTRAK